MAERLAFIDAQVAVRKAAAELRQNALNDERTARRRPRRE
jgi:hypothetical protein